MKEMEAKTENRYEYRKSQEKRKQMIAPDLFEFAYVPDWYGHLAELERLALPESWKFRKPSRETKNTDTPILERYIHTIFRKQVIDFNSESDPRKADSIFHLENECVCFHTGLYTRQYKGIYGYFERNNFSDSLRDWYFRGFCDEMSPKLRYIEPLPQKFEKVGSVVAGVGTAIAAAAAAIGAAVVAASVELVKLGDEYNKAVNQISASTGATGTELEELGAIAQKVYTNNFGDSLEDVAEGLSVVQKTTGLVGDELQKATESGFALRDTFGYDLQESARAANALMKNFGVTAEEAYNIIAVGAQNGADQNGDLLDTLNEYSAQYSALGLSADQFVTGLINGAEAGVFSIDKVGDAVKEFNLRAKDGSNTTIEAFRALGMNADEMTKRFAAGGESAEEAFFEVVNALNNMDDPIAKNTAAVNLFGTQFEDLQANVLPVLAGMKDGAAASYDALSQINEIKYADLDSALEGTKRSIEGVFLPTVSQMSAGITDVFSTLGNAINEANGDFSQISVAIGTAIGDVAAIITEQMPMFLELGLNIVTSIGGAILENLPILIESATNIVLTILNSLIAALPQITEGALFVTEAQGMCLRQQSVLLPEN